MVAREEGPFLVEPEAQVVRRVPRRVHRPQGDALHPGGDLTIDHTQGRLEVEVGALLHRHRRRFGSLWLGLVGRRHLVVIVVVEFEVGHLEIARPRMGPEPHGRRAGLGRQPRGEWRVVGMAVGDQDRSHSTTGQRCSERVAVRVEPRPRVDHHHLGTCADDVGTRTVIGELRRVLRHDTGDRRRHRNRLGVPRVGECDKGDCAHRSKALTSPTTRP